MGTSELTRTHLGHPALQALADLARVTRMTDPRKRDRKALRKRRSPRRPTRVRLRVGAVAALCIQCASDLEGVISLVSRLPWF